MVKTGQLTELNGRQTLLLDPELRRREEENLSYMMHLENSFLGVSHLPAEGAFSGALAVRCRHALSCHGRQGN